MSDAYAPDIDGKVTKKKKKKKKVTNKSVLIMSDAVGGKTLANKGGLGPVAMP